MAVLFSAVTITSDSDQAEFFVQVFQKVMLISKAGLHLRVL